MNTNAKHKQRIIIRHLNGINHSTLDSWRLMRFIRIETILPTVNAKTLYSIWCYFCRSYYSNYIMLFSYSFSSLYGFRNYIFNWAIKANSRTDPFIQKLIPFIKWCSRNQYSNKTPSNSSRAFKIQPWEPRIKIQFCRWHEIKQKVMVFENY